MNKTAIKNFAIWARNKLIADIKYKASLLGITEKEIKEALPQSTKDVQFFDIGTKEPYSISGIEIKQREKLVETINDKAKQSDYNTAYKAVVEEVAYTWFNRLIAVRFMEVNDYLPSRIRVLSSESATKIEPDLVTSPFDSDLDFSPYEKDRIVQLKHDNKLDELFQMLFIKKCNALNSILPNLFQKTSDYTELLLNVSFTDKDGVVYRLVHDILEDDFNVSKEGQVEIIGWLYQYYNTEPKDEAFALLKKKVKITKERIPAATQLFTPDWIVRYMVENSLGRLWLEGHPNDVLKSEWKYYLDEAEQEEDVQRQLEVIREEYKAIKPEDIKVIDPCMGSGHILVYAFDVLMQIYESCGYSKRDAARSILEHNIYGLDIDNRAYQLAYFAIMMKARHYNRRILDGDTDCNVYSIQESNGINRNHLKYFGAGMSDIERNTAILQVEGLLDTFVDAKEYGSILNVENYNWELLNRFIWNIELSGQLSLDAIGIEDTKEELRTLVCIGSVMAHKYNAVITNPPYRDLDDMNYKFVEWAKKNYATFNTDLISMFIIKCNLLCKKHGYISMITTESWMFLPAYLNIRENILNQESVVSLLHMDIKLMLGFSTVATILSKRNLSYYGNYIYMNEMDLDNESPLVFPTNNARNRVLSHYEFFKMPNYVFAYWCSDKLKEIFKGSENISTKYKVDSGIKTGKNEIFLRKWYEVSKCNTNSEARKYEDICSKQYKWYRYNKGGGVKKWYGNIEYVINLQNNAFDIKNTVSKSTYRLRTPDNYFKKSIAFSLIGETFSSKLCTEGVLNDVTSNAVYFSTNTSIDYFLIALLNTNVVNKILKIINPTLGFTIDSINNIPYLRSTIYENKICNMAKKSIEISKFDWDCFETSWDFTIYPLINGNSVQSAFENWQNECNNRFAQLKDNEEELNRIFIDIYGLQDELLPVVEDKDVTLRQADFVNDIKGLISYAVGCMFGRYSLDFHGLVFAGGQWDDSKYSTFIPDKDNIIPITDEEYLQDDIVGLFVAFVKKVYGAETLEENLDFIAKALSNKGNTSREIIRNYFLKDFFKDHCKVYQKRPIYWLFNSGKANGFKALIYLHRYDENTIGNLRIDYLHRMQRVYESEIARMQETIENSTNAREVAAAEKRKEKLTKQLKETKEYDEKIAHLALARISIDLDDGVKVNYEKVQTGNDGKKLEVLAKI